MIGEKYGMLEVVSRGTSKNSDGTLKWVCKCECGTLKEIARCNLVKKKNATVSCGCINQKHGCTDTPEYDAWCAMRRRCENPKDTRYSEYGGRGITVCERWQIFTNFLEDVGKRPTMEHSLDRQDNNKGYFKENVGWSTTKQQMNNKQNTHMLTVDGETKPLQIWCELLGLNPKTVSTRLCRGWSAARALA